MPPLGCDALTRAHPGVGAAYKGTVTNDDYRLTLTIPSGLTGWGAALYAPFHGFSIFLDGACILFEVHIRVDIPEDVERPTAEPQKHVSIGGRAGFETIRTGTVHGVPFENRIVSLELNRKNEQDEVTFTLASRVAAAKKNNELFDRLVGSLLFY